MAKQPDRISEADLLIPTLEILAEQPDGRVTTSNLIVELESRMKPTGQDLQLLDGRNDTYFSQIVRNMISHKTTPGNIIAEGFAIHLGTGQGLQITEAGRVHLVQRLA